MNRLEQGPVSEGKKAFSEKLSGLLGPDYEFHTAYRPAQGEQTGLDKFVWQRNIKPSSPPTIFPAIEFSRPVYEDQAPPEYTVAVRALAAPYSQNSSDTPEWYAALYGSHFPLLGLRLDPVPPSNLDAMDSDTATRYAITIHPALVEASNSIATVEGLRQLRGVDTRGFVIFSKSGRNILQSQ